jgi:hypothetical protein
MKSKQKHQRMMAVAVERVGPVKAYKAALFIASWGHVTKNLGRPPVTVDEYADWWNKSRAMGFREQRLFREAFPHLETPTAICEWLEENDAKVFDGDPAEAAFQIGAVL